MEPWTVAVESVGKQYANAVWGVRELSFRLRSGSLVALVGDNGAGKTTLIHLLAGVISPTEGVIAIDPYGGQRMGWCSQRHSIDWFLSVQDNVMLGARLAGLSRSDSQRQTNEALCLVGLEKCAQQLPDELSGGQQQRLQIARALVHEPSFLLLDEPTTGLDPSAASLLMDTIRQKTRQGALAIVSSHDLSLIDGHADVILFLQGGRQVACSPRGTFMEQLADNELLKIVYEGQLVPERLAALSGMVAKIIRTDPLEMLVQRETPLDEIIALLGPAVRVVEVRRSLPGLREAYFFLSSKSCEVGHDS